jgi:hypothetical protein
VGGSSQPRPRTNVPRRRRFSRNMTRVVAQASGGVKLLSVNVFWA